MQTNQAPTRRRGSRPYMVAMVLGTALSTLGTGSLTAAPANAEATQQAVTDLSRYCTACWRNARLRPELWTDCTQEVLRRLLERVPPEDWERVLGDEGEERREFFRAIDAVKKRTVRARKWANGPVETVADRRDQDERRLAEEREEVRRAAEAVLSDRQQRILQLCFEGWAIQEIAEELQLPADRVSDEKYKAVRKLQTHLRGRERQTVGV